MGFLRRFTCTLILALLASIAGRGADSASPWTSADLISASDLNHKLDEVNSGKITLICVGFGVIYRMGHIPGSQYAGPASQPDGLASLRKLVANLPRVRLIVIYCGCCPWDHCPNIRPAYAALREMGFTNIKLLEIPQRFYDNWTAKGLPTVKGE
jgi:thiosulfate/3-mercaptopyruvate sulfurtransferase